MSEALIDSTEREIEYWAFISYSHIDQEIAGWVRQSVEEMRIPPGLPHPAEGPPASGRFFPIFRDREELPVAADLGDNLYHALRHSRSLLLLCSPKSAQSMWVNAEVAYFIEHRGIDNIICLLVRDDASPPSVLNPAVLPEALRSVWSDSAVAARTTFIDVRKKPPPKETISAIAAALLGVAPEAYRTAFRRGTLRRVALTLACIVPLLLFLSFMLHAKWQAFARLERQRYISSLQDAESAWMRGDLRVVNSLLESTSRNRNREFEWYYLWSELHRTRMMFSGQDGEVADIDYSPDGRWLATGDDERVRIRDAASGRTVKEFTLGNGGVMAVQFSAGGTMLLACSQYDGVHLWSVGDWKELAVIEHDDFLVGASFCRQDRAVLLHTRDAAEVWTISPKVRRLVIRDTRNEIISSSAMSPDGQEIVLTFRQSSIGYIYDAVSGREIHRLTGHEGLVWSAEYSPDGRRIVTAGGDNTARIWDARSGKSLAILGSHSSDVINATFSSDGSLVATMEDDGIVHIWQTDMGSTMPILLGHPDAVLAADFSPDGARVATACTDGVARVWDIQPGCEPFRQAFACAAFFPDSRRIAVGEHAGTIAVIDIVNGARLAETAAGAGPVFRICVSPDGRHVLAQTPKGLELWDAALRQRVSTIAGATIGVSTSVFSPDSRRFLYQSAGKLRSAAVQTGKTITEFAVPSEWVMVYCFSPNGRQVATGMSDGRICLLNSNTGRLEQEYPAHREMATSVAFSPNGRQLVSAGSDGTVLLYDSRQKQSVWVLTYLNAQKKAVGLYFADFLPGGRRILTASMDQRLIVLDPVDGAEIFGFIGAPKVLQVLISPDGRHILNGGNPLAPQPTHGWSISTWSRDAQKREPTESL